MCKDDVYKFICDTARVNANNVVVISGCKYRRKLEFYKLF